MSAPRLIAISPRQLDRLLAEARSTGNPARFDFPHAFRPCELRVRWHGERFELVVVAELTIELAEAGRAVNEAHRELRGVALDYVDEGRDRRERSWWRMTPKANSGQGSIFEGAA